MKSNKTQKLEKKKNNKYNEKKIAEMLSNVYVVYPFVQVNTIYEPAWNGWPTTLHDSSWIAMYSLILCYESLLVKKLMR